VTKEKVTRGYAQRENADAMEYQQQVLMARRDTLFHSMAER
jgi:hypothetical protein